MLDKVETRSRRSNLESCGQCYKTFFNVIASLIGLISVKKIGKYAASGVK
jgi:hypothetical protein